MYALNMGVTASVPAELEPSVHRYKKDDYWRSYSLTPQARESIRSSRISIGTPVPAGILRVLEDAYGHSTREMGYETEGHMAIGREDMEIAQTTGCSLLYGEVLPEGVMKMMDTAHLHASASKRLFDLGSGTGKLCMQVFLCFMNLLEVTGIEISPSRYRIAEAAALRLVDGCSKRFRMHSFSRDSEISICEDADDRTHKCSTPCLSTGGRRCRILRLKKADLFDLITSEMHSTDIVVMETDLPEPKYTKVCKLISTLPPSTRVMTYLDLHSIWPSDSDPGALPFNIQHVKRTNAEDRFATSWAFHSGHPFFMWQVTAKSNPVSAAASPKSSRPGSARMAPYTAAISPLTRQFRINTLLSLPSRSQVDFIKYAGDDEDPTAFDVRTIRKQ